MSGPSYADIPGDVRRFIDRCLFTLEQIDILLFLTQRAHRFWDASGIAEALSLTPRGTAAHLEALARCNLLDVHIGAHVSYRFAPATDDVCQAVRELSEAYRDNRTAIVSYVTRRRIRTLRDFADSFRLKDEQDG